MELSMRYNDPHEHRKVPPLAAGDQLTREDFLRRWEADPKIKIAELIGGPLDQESISLRSCTLHPSHPRLRLRRWRRRAHHPAGDAARVPLHRPRAGRE